MKKTSYLLSSIATCVASMIFVGCGTSGNTAKELALQDYSYIPMELDGTYLYIDKDGNEITTNKFSSASLFSEGLALVLDSANTLYGYINTKGEYAIPPKYTSATMFFDGLAWVAEPDSCLKAIDKEGNTILRLPNATSAHVFVEGYSVISQNGKSGMIDREGNITIAPKYNSLQYPIRGMVYSSLNDSVALLNTDGSVIVPAGSYDIILPNIYNDNLLVCNGTKFGVVDRNLNILINPKYSHIEPHDGYYIVKEDDEYGIIDLDGNVLLPAKNERITSSNYSDMILYSKDGDKWGALNSKGEKVIRPKFENASNFFGDYAAVKNKEDKWGIIDRMGEYVIEPQFDRMLPIPGNGKYLARTDRKWGIVDAKGTFIDMPKYSSFRDGKGYTSAQSDYFNINEIVQGIKSWIDAQDKGLTYTQLRQKYPDVEFKDEEYGNYGIGALPAPSSANVEIGIFSTCAAPSDSASIDQYLAAYECGITIPSAKSDKLGDLEKALNDTFLTDGNSVYNDYWVTSIDSFDSYISVRFSPKSLF